MYSDNLDGDYSGNQDNYISEKPKKKQSASDGIDWLISAVVGVLTIVIGWALIPQIGWRVDTAVAGILSGSDFDSTMWSTVTNPDMPTGQAFWGTVSSFIVIMAVALFVMFFVKMLLGIQRGRNEL